MMSSRAVLLVSIVVVALLASLIGANGQVSSHQFQPYSHMVPHQVFPQGIYSLLCVYFRQHFVTSLLVVVLHSFVAIHAIHATV
jgi:hypothetical protein